MLLKSYYNPNTHEVRIRNQPDAAEAAPFVSLGNINHTVSTDNANGMQNKSVSHVIYQHVQEQLYLQRGMQDMQIVKITPAGTFKLIESFNVNHSQPYVAPGETIKVTPIVLPADATKDGFYLVADNPDLVEIAAGTGPDVGSFIVTMKAAGQTILRCGVSNTNLREHIAVEAKTEPQ